MNYQHKRQQAQAISRVQCGRIEYHHTNDNRKVLSFSAQEIVELPGNRQAVNSIDDLRTEFTGRESDSFDLVSLENGNAVGTATYGDLQAMLFSAFLQAEKDKENREQLEQEEEARQMRELEEQEAQENA